MNAYVTKEVRLIMPAYLTALTLAIVPVWLMPWNEGGPVGGLLLFVIAVAVLALSPFGREFSMATFPLLLAHPMARQRIWRTKISVLAAPEGTVLCAESASSVGAWWSREGAEAPSQAVMSDLGQTLFTLAAVLLALLTGGLWSTLLVRQVAAAFWFTVFVPAGMVMITATLGGTVPWICAVLCLYSAAGFVLASRLFHGAQEAMWTGGTVALSGWGSTGAGSISPSRSCRPLAALFVKELQLQQVSLFGMLGLMAMHIVVVAGRRVAQNSVQGTIGAVLDFYPFVWMFVPLLVGGLSVAEERRLGTMEAHLGLPVSRRIQFLIKVLFVLVLGGLLPLGLLLGAEWIGTAVGAPAQIGIFDSEKTPIVLGCTLLAGSFISLYASSLSRNLLQSLGISVVLACLTFALYKAGPDMDQIWNFPSWHGSIFHLVAWPMLTIVVLSLAYGNFRRLASDLWLWRRNVGWLVASLAVGALLTTAIYQRAWEFILPLEPAHEAARLSPTRPPALRGDPHRSAFTALLPDGGLRVNAFRRDFEHAPLSAPRVNKQLVWIQDENRPLADSNWVDAFAYHSGVVGIRSNGTLWISERPTPLWSPSTQPLNLVRFGSDTNWQRIVRAQLDSLWLLKVDGTLWRWGPPPRGSSNVDLRMYEPVRLGEDSDWATVMASDSMTYAWKKDGQAWALYGETPASGSRPHEFQTGRIQQFDNTRWRNLASAYAFEVGVREDGTLWTWRTWGGGDTLHQGESLMIPQQIGKETDWASASANWSSVTALKADGSLWRWKARWKAGRYDMSSVFERAPTRRSKHADWVTLASVFAGYVSVAADGGLWYWPEDWDRAEVLAASRTPIKLESVFWDDK